MSGAAGGPRPGLVFESRSESETARLAARFAGTFEPAPGRAVRVGLSGDLGAGKTTFVRGLLRQLGVTRAIRSPTYSLVERYDVGGFEVMHADLYRLESPEALAALALDDADRPGGLWLVEWPERGAGALPPADLRIDLSIQGDGRACGLTPLSLAGRTWLAALTTAQSLAAPT